MSLRYVAVLAILATTLATAGPAVAAPGLRAIEAQHLSWTGCAGIDDPRLQCAEVTVLLDYSHPDRRTITVGISRLPATDPVRRRGVILTTGGGPSSPGVPLPEQLKSIVDPRILAEYDLVGFDPRFLERSTPIGCGQPTEEPGGFWVRSATYQSFSQTEAEARRYAADCARAAGWALPYATTDNVARISTRSGAVSN